MKTKHTPGPWRCDGMKRVSDRTPDHFAVLGPNGIEAIADCFYGRTDNERAANARLIAAAPELAEALATVIARVEDRLASCDDWNAEPLKSDIEAARAALAKATIP